MHQAEEIRLDGSSVELAARRWKMGSTPVLALHGWLDNAGTYDRLAPLLKGLDLVALDFPGHGYSGHRPPGAPHHFVDWVPEVFAAADSLGWERFGLMGHSMGGGVAALVAGTFPQRIERLVLIEGIGPFASPDEEAPQLLAKALLYRPSTGKRIYETREKAVARLSARGLKQESADCLAQRAVEPVDGGWAFSYAPEVRAPSRARLTETQVRAFLRAITAPTLLVVASDGLEMPDSFVGRDREVPNLELLEESGGHHLHLDYPERIAGPVLAHLRGRT